MIYNELRKDYLLDRWVVIATARGRRPTDFARKEREQAKTSVCPMCLGNEHMTPPAVLVYLKTGKTFTRAKESNDSRQKNWLVRVVPNLFPAFTPPGGKLTEKQIHQGNDTTLAIGNHEVLVESPIHDEDPADARTSQLSLVIRAYVDRLSELSASRYVRYVSIFRNHGLEAGASLSHAHSQIIATPFVPGILAEEMHASRQHWKQNKSCVFCEIIKKERKGPRSIFENADFIAFAPYASINPMEFWILPKKHQSTLLQLSKAEMTSLAETMKICLKGLKTLANDPPYNYGFHLAVDKSAFKYYHWHLEVYPTLAVWAGFEKSTGIYINTVTPEVAAESMREVISS